MLDLVDAPCRVAGASLMDDKDIIRKYAQQRFNNAVKQDKYVADILYSIQRDFDAVGRGKLLDFYKDEIKTYEKV